MRLINADVLVGLSELDDASVDCIVTSPPYWGLRDYGVDDQVGQEKTIGEYVDKLVRVFREARRVLKPTGTLWLNLGDSFSARGGKPGNDNKGNPHASSYARATELPAKSLCGIPWRVARTFSTLGIAHYFASRQRPFRLPN